MENAKHINFPAFQTCPKVSIFFTTILLGTCLIKNLNKKSSGKKVT
jgi:hypothetical protein